MPHSFRGSPPIPIHTAVSTVGRDGTSHSLFSFQPPHTRDTSKANIVPMLRQTYRISGLGLRTPNVHCLDVSVACFRDLSCIHENITSYFVQVVTKGVICGTVKSSGVQRSRNDARLNHLMTMAELHRTGRYDRMADGVERVTGRPAMSVREFVSLNADEFGGRRS